MRNIIFIVITLLVFSNIQSIKEIEIFQKDSIEKRFERNFFYSLFSEYLNLDSFIKSNQRKSKFLIKHKSTIQKYYSDYKKMLGRFEQNSTFVTEKVINYWETLFYGEIEVGNPPQKINVQFDTGSSDLWIALPKCKGCDDSITFDPTKSTTLKITNTSAVLLYGSGNANGTQAYDTVRISGLQVDDFQLVLVDSAVGFSYENPENGLLGLDYPINSMQNPKAPNIIQTLKNNNQIKDAVFSFYLTKDYNQNGSRLFIGGYNSDYFEGPINYVPISYKTWYYVDYEGYEVNNKTFTDPRGMAFVDSGTTLIHTDKSVTDGLQSEIGTIDPQCSGINYEKLPTINILINGIKYPLTPQEYIFNSHLYSECRLSILPNSLSVFGDQFLKVYYTIFDLDNNQLGFARAKHD